MMQSVSRIIATLFLVFATGSASAAGFQYLSIPDDDGKPIELGIWYPTSDANAVAATLADISQTVAIEGQIKGDRLPLLVFSHGGEGRYDDRSDSARMLADAGFVAVALTHPGDNYKDVERDILQRLINRPRQISRVLDYVTQLWSGRTHLDPSKIGFYGFSNGGFTGLVAIGGIPDWKLFVPHCTDNPAEGVCKQGGAKRLSNPAAAAIPAFDWHQDTRIKAAVLVSPAYTFAFEPTSLSDITIPVELWGSSGDRVVPYTTNIGYLQRYLPAVFGAHDVEGAGHPSFLRPCSDALRLRLPDRCNDRPGFDRAAFQNTLNQSLVSFFKAELKGE